MAGAYCRYCDHRCFVDRRLPDDAKRHAGQHIHLATCAKGSEFDREVTGYDYKTAINYLKENADRLERREAVLLERGK